MKSTRILLATLALSGAPLLAAPAAPVIAPAPMAPAPVPLDVATVALLDKSAKAYAARESLSLDFASSTQKTEGEPEDLWATQGTLAFSRPGKARVEYKMAGLKNLTVQDGTTTVSKIGANSYLSRKMSGAPSVWSASRIPSLGSFLLGNLISGSNPLTAPDGIMQWSSAKLMTDAFGVELKGMMQQGELIPFEFKIYLDPASLLLTRIESQGEIYQSADSRIATKEVTTFAVSPVAVTPELFEFVTPAGATLTEYKAPIRYDERLIVGAQPFALTGKTLEGKTLSLDSYKGKVVLLDFWATWCGPCIGELPNVQANYQKYKAQEFDIIAVSLDEEESDLRDFVKAKELPWPQIFDGKGWQAGDAKTYGVRSIPFTLLIGKDGKIASVNPRGEALEPAIKAALAK